MKAESKLDENGRINIPRSKTCHLTYNSIELLILLLGYPPDRLVKKNKLGLPSLFSGEESTCRCRRQV